MDGFKEGLKGTRGKFGDAVDPEYVFSVFGGNPASKIKAEAEDLGKFDHQMLDAISDVESEMS